jgi:hypothetical protein
MTRKTKDRNIGDSWTSPLRNFVCLVYFVVYQTVVLVC